MDVEHSGPPGENCLLRNEAMTPDVDSVLVAVVVAALCGDIPRLKVVVLHGGGGICSEENETRR